MMMQVGEGDGLKVEVDNNTRQQQQSPHTLSSIYILQQRHPGPLFDGMCRMALAHYIHIHTHSLSSHRFHPHTHASLMPQRLTTIFLYVSKNKKPTKLFACVYVCVYV